MWRYIGTVVIKPNAWPDNWRWIGYILILSNCHFGSWSDMVDLHMHLRCVRGVGLVVHVEWIQRRTHVQRDGEKGWREDRRGGDVVIIMHGCGRMGNEGTPAPQGLFGNHLRS